MSRSWFKISLLALLLSFNSLFALTSPYQSLRNISTARATGLSGAFVSVLDDAGAVFYNPATVFTVSSKPLSVSFLKHVLDINSGNVAYVTGFENVSGRFAGSVSYMNFGSFNQTDKSGNELGTFGANDLALALTYSNELDTNLYYGVSVKFLWLNLEKSYSTAMAVDAGLLYTIPKNNVSLGLSVLHAGSQISTLQGENEPLPLDIRAGINHRLRGLPLLINFSLHHLADKTDNFFDKFLNFSIGGEIYLGEYVQARLGYDNQIRKFSAPSGEKKFAGLSAGVGIKAKDFNFDYGMAEMGVAGLIHRFTLGLDL
jgi:hypothetical protein